MDPSLSLPNISYAPSKQTTLMRDFKRQNQNSSIYTVKAFDIVHLRIGLMSPGKSPEECYCLWSRCLAASSCVQLTLREQWGRWPVPPHTWCAHHTAFWTRPESQPQATQIFKFLLLPPGSVIPNGKGRCSWRDVNQLLRQIPPLLSRPILLRRTLLQTLRVAPSTEFTCFSLTSPALKQPRESYTERW